MQHAHSFSKGLSILPALFGLAGCSVMGSGLPDVATETATIYSSPKANDNSPVALEMVLVRDQDLLKDLTALPASEWFPQREQFLRDHPTELASWYWEVTPGQTLPLNPVPFKGESAVGVLFYANYSSKGPHRARIDTYETLKVRLGERDFSIEAVE